MTQSQTARIRGQKLNRQKRGVRQGADAIGGGSQKPDPGKPEASDEAPSNSTQTPRRLIEGQTFTLSFHEWAIRAIHDGDQPWFDANDICAALEIKNQRDATARLDADEKGVGLCDTPGGPRESNVVNESGLYVLILRSRRATTPGTVQHRFRRWVTGEVLPSIRKTGTYAKTSGSGQPGNAGAIQIEAARPGIYVVTVHPDRSFHVRQTEYDAMRAEWQVLNGQAMACGLLSIAAFWQMV
jgi:hypothetical protein